MLSIFRNRFFLISAFVMSGAFAHAASSNIVSCDIDEKAAKESPKQDCKIFGKNLPSSWSNKMMDWGILCQDKIGKALKDQTDGPGKADDPISFSVINSALGGNPPNGSSQEMFNGRASTAAKSCIKMAELARGACLEALSPHLRGAAGYLEVSIAGIKQMTGQKLICSKYKETVEFITNSLTAYNAACGAALVACEMTCSTASETPFDETTMAVGTTSPAAFKEAADKPCKKLKRIAAACEGSVTNLVGAGLGIVSGFLSKDAAKKCETATATATAAVDTSVNCSDPAQAKNNIYCICDRSPRTAGCPGAELARGDSDQSTPSVVSASALTPTTDGGANSSSAGRIAGGKSSGGGGSGLGTAASSGAVAGTGGSVDQSRSALGLPSKLNTNILGGDYSGGGGGRGGRGGSQSAEKIASNKFKSFLPGGANDPSREPTSADALWNNQVTGPGGKSNWQKIRDQYLNSQSTLLEK